MGDVSDIPDKSWKMLESLRRRDGTSPSSSSKLETDQVRKSANGEALNGHPPARTSLEASLTRSVLSMDLSHSNGNGKTDGMFTPTTQPPLILIIDSLWPTRTHTSHYNFPQALSAAMRLNADMTYLLGFTHPTTHFQWEELCLSIRGMEGKREDHPDSTIAKALVKNVWSDEPFEGESGKKLKQWGGRVEPAWDGLKLEVSTEGWTEVETRSVMIH
jgi:hypothetical protein